MFENVSEQFTLYILTTFVHIVLIGSDKIKSVVVFLQGFHLHFINFILRLNSTKLNGLTFQAKMSVRHNLIIYLSSLKTSLHPRSKKINVHLFLEPAFIMILSRLFLCSTGAEITSQH